MNAPLDLMHVAQADTNGTHVHIERVPLYNQHEENTTAQVDGNFYSSHASRNKIGYDTT